MVPFLLRSPTTGQGTSPTSPGGNNNNNNNNNNGGVHGKGGGSENCAESKSESPKSHDANSHGNAWGVIKNKLDTTAAAIKAMGTHDPAFHLHHDTDTDNEASEGAHGHSQHSADPDSSCAAGDEEHNED
jgi:hypothetical protein